MSSEIYEAVADLLPVGILVISEQGRLLEANQPGLELLGLDHRAFEHPAFGVLLESEILREALAERRDEVRRMEVCEGGHDLRVEIRPLPEGDEGTTLLLLQESSATSTAAAQKRNFVFDILHKVRTPLTTIVSVLSLASSDRLDTSRVDTSELLAMGLKQADRLTVFLSRLRDLFLVETGTLDAELRVEPATVAVMMGQAMADLRAKFAGKRQTLVEDYPDEELKALVDRAVFGRALELVILNAYQYTPERGTIRIGAVRRNGSISIRIQDDGPGIPEEELPRLFERFYRGSTAIAAEVEGEGLGLYLARHLLLAIGATIHLDSRVGQGTEIEILLPAVEISRVSDKATILCIGGGRDLCAQSRLALREFGPVRELPGGRDQTRRDLEEASLVVVTAPVLAGDRDIGWWLRERTGAALLLLHDASESGPFADRGFDDWAPEGSDDEVRDRGALLIALQQAWQRGRELSLDGDSLRADLTRFGTDPGLVDERGLVTPGRVAIQHLVDVEAAIRQQLAVCRLMGTSYGTFLSSEHPCGLPLGDGSESSPLGALSPYCAYLAGRGDYCLQSEFGTAREALLTGQPVERECVGGLLVLAVPVILSFGELKWPLYAATVAVRGTATPEAIERAARESGAHPVILKQLLEESRFWVLNPDKVDGIRSTLSNLAETVSREVSHKYATAYQVYHRALYEKEIHISRELLSRSHEALESTNRSLRLKNEEIYEVTQAITHDLRKPLVSLKAMISLLQKESLGQLNSSQREAVDTASEANDYMMNLIRDLLEAARLETGRKLMDMQETLLRPVVARVRRRFKYQIEESGIHVKVEEFPDTAWCDEAALEKVFMNLLGNAIAYIGDNERTIRMWGRVDGKFVRISVADTGIGIPKASLPRVFEKFHRGENAAGTHGTGLGLGIVKAIVEAHGGTVEIESEADTGTTISFTLPFRNHQAATAYRANPLAPGRSIGR